MKRGVTPTTKYKPPSKFRPPSRVACMYEGDGLREPEDILGNYVLYIEVHHSIQDFFTI